MPPIYRTDDAERIRFGNELVELTFDRATGRWLSLADTEDGRTVLSGGELLSPVLLTVNGRAQSSRGIQQMFSVADAETVGLRWRLEGFDSEVGPERGWLVVRLAEGDWRVELRYGLRAELARVERQVRIAYEGEGEALLRHFVLRQPYAVVDAPATSYIEAPGHPVRPKRRVSALPFGPWGQLYQGTFCDAPAWRPPLVGIHDPKAERVLGFWAWTDTEPFYPLVERTDDGVLLAHRVHLADRFTRGHALEWGAQYVQVWHADWLGALEEFQRFYDEVGFTVPRDTPEWAKAIDMYEVHVGTLTGTDLAPFPTYEPLLEELPRIRERGFDAVYLMPHVPYPSYSVIDYLNMDIQQGSVEGFRAFVRRAHEVGLKVFIDVTMHGVMDRRARRMLAALEGHSEKSYPMETTMPEVHPYVAEHPEWFLKTERGDVAMTYTWSFDHANPGWQDFMARVFRHYVEEYDVDGFRVDSHTWNFFPNWARDLPYPASRSFYGSAQLFRRVRRELKAIKPDVVLYAETAGPLFHDTHELGYNYDETWMLLSVLPVVSRKGLLCHFAHPAQVTTERMNARDMAWWLAQRQRVMPRGAIKVHHLDCHDTYWGPREFRSRTFGPAARAIVALFAFTEGGFMDYHGAEEGSEEFYRTIMRLRRTQPALKQGTCDYLAVQPTDKHKMVLAPLREGAGQLLLPVIHFDNATTSVGLQIPPDRLPADAESFEVRDLMSDRALPGPAGPIWQRDELAGLRVDIGPYGVMLLDIRPAAGEQPRRAD